MKRNNDQGQLRAEEVEALNETESEEAGVFKRADASVLASRKILRVSRNSLAPPLEEAKSNPGNPFAAMKNFLTPSSSINFPSANIFNFGKSTNGAPSLNFGTNNSINSISDKKSGLDANQNAGSKPMDNANSTANFSSKFSSTYPINGSINVDSNTKPSAIIPSKSSQSNIEEYRSKLLKLNQSFVKWVQFQLSDNPISIWKDGLKDYIKYSESLMQKYGITKDDIIQFEISDDVVNDMASTVTPAPTSNFTFKTQPNNLASSAVASSTSTTSTTTLPQSQSISSSANITNSTVPTTTPAFSTSFTGFSFSKNGPLSLPSFPSASTSGFSFNGLTKANPASLPIPAISSTLPSNGGGLTFNTNEDNGSDDEAEPILEPEKILRNEDDKDEILYEINCKLYKFFIDKSDEKDKKPSEWKDLGKNLLRITKDINTSKQRILIRNSLGKILVNCFFMKDMKFERIKNSIKFFAYVTDDQGTGLRNYLIKLKNDDVESTLQVLEQGKLSCGS